jgi:hypothetical protein
MAKAEKLIDRLKTVPKDFTWDEVIKILSLFGYTEQKTGKTGGSRRRFSDKNNNVINSLHKPHPGKILKRYAVEDLLAYLKEKGHIKDE